MTRHHHIIKLKFLFTNNILNPVNCPIQSFKQLNNNEDKVDNIAIYVQLVVDGIQIFVCLEYCMEEWKKTHFRDPSIQLNCSYELTTDC